MSEINITKKGWKCIRCNHQWTPKKGFKEKEKPKTCPKCRSPYWDTEKKR